MVKRKSLYVLLYLVSFTVFTNINRGQNSEPPIAKAPPVDLIQYGDLIDVDVIGSTEFDWRGQLSPEGFLDGIDFLDAPVFALCQSEDSVAKKLEAAFAKLLRNPQIHVKILDKNGRALSYLYGAVKHPQRFQLIRAAKLNELIILSGGFDEKVGGDISILRSDNLNCANKRENPNSSMTDFTSNIIDIKISDLLKGDPKSNPVILNGDVITVTEADPLYVIGGVNNPRQIPIHGSMTLTQAIASAGGLTKSADPHQVTIYRHSSSQSERIEADLDKIAKSEGEDVILQKYDIVEIAQNGELKKKYSPVVKIVENDTKSKTLPLRIVE